MTYARSAIFALVAVGFAACGGTTPPAHNAQQNLEGIIQDVAGNPAAIANVDTWGQTYHIPFGLASDGADVLGPYYNISAFPMQMIIRTSDMKIMYQENGEHPASDLQAVFDQIIQ